MFQVKGQDVQTIIDWRAGDRELATVLELFRILGGHIHIEIRITPFGERAARCGGRHFANDDPLHAGLRAKRPIFVSFIDELLTRIPAGKLVSA